MSWFTSLRNDIESVASLVGNYYLPGSSLVTDQLVSKGSQAQLGTGLGQLAQIGTGVAGGYAGNTANYGNLYDAATGGTGTMSNALVGGGTPQGLQQATQAAQTMIQQGASPAEAIQIANLTPAQAEAAGLNAGAGMTWQDIATQAGIPYGTAQTPRAGTGSPSMLQMLGNLGQGVTPGDITGMLRANGLQTLGGGVGSMPWGSPGNLLTMGSGLYGILSAQQLKKQAAQLAAQADPFAAYRPGYAAQLSALEANPSSITSTPGYTAGLQAVERSMGAQGYQGSGNMMAALANYGGNAYQQQVSQLSGLAGANLNPASAGQLALTGSMGASSLTGQGLASLGYGAYLAGRG
jgi:hypothetical protein